MTLVLAFQKQTDYGALVMNNGCKSKVLFSKLSQCLPFSGKAAVITGMAVKEIFRCIRGFVQVYCAGWCLSEFGCNVFKCEGSSMKPTIKDNDIVLTNQWAVVTDNIHKGDIVIARSMDNPNRLICKRVVAMEEEKVRTGIFHETVPKGHVWLEGDNKSESRDSREYGPVPRGLIIGKVVYKVYPFNERSVIK